jgi:GMP synthase-like glutamine amidotransferase
VAVIQQDADVTAGRFAALLPEAVAFDAAVGLPDPGDFDRLVVLGGRMSVEDTARFPYLADVEHLMAAAVDQGVPVLAVCLAHQQLARVFGGAVTVGAADAAERAVLPVRLRPEARRDPVLGPVWDRLGPVVVAPSSHDDAVRALPDGAVWLAESDRCPYHAFRLGSALAVQFHPEADLALFTRWATLHGDDDLSTYEAQYATHEPALQALAATLTAAFLAASPRP